MELFDNTSTDPNPENKNPSDDEIKNKIERIYAGNEEMRKLNINVKVNKRVVTLEGVVHSPQSWERAQDLAADVVGVTKIENRIKVEPGPTQSA